MNKKGVNSEFKIFFSKSNAPESSTIRERIGKRQLCPASATNLLWGTGQVFAFSLS